MTIALEDGSERSRAVAFARRVNLAVVVLLVFYLAVGFLQPSYLEPAGIMNFLRRAAPLAILASGQIFVLVSGGFDLSVGSLVTLTVIGGSMLAANDPREHLVGDRRPLRDRTPRWPRQRIRRRLS
jgi:ribose transport system permease protein